MKARYCVALGITTLFIVSGAQEQNVEIQTNRQDIKWNSFQLFLQLGGIIAACFPLASLTGVGIPLCALSTLAAFSTAVCLTLKIFDGLITKDDQLAPQVLMFLHSIGLRFTGEENIVSTMNGEDSGKWKDWANSQTAAAFRDLNTCVEFSIETVSNSAGMVRPSYCFSFLIDESTAHPLAGYWQTTCLSQVAIQELNQTRPKRLPPKALSSALRPLKKVDFLKSYAQAFELAQSFYSIFGIYAEEFLMKSVALIQDLGPDNKNDQKLGFQINDQINGQQEQLFRVELVKRLLM
ncbi:LANO_0E07426g1_1 [Lachancea nothofagi CBS 11611]|uniref:LANO_0E07426g1_1 n=1 Tax=Lachancea nothofagi CBS 11611 TaxID=1266666 RepID=A0A1G4JUI3_9SACH|nr:LANO_0E07426g1_1 [Lachancea nothofagi CBS 11611]